MALIPCPNCGAMVSDQASFCPRCGAALNSSSTQQPAYQQVSPVQQTYQTKKVDDTPNGGLNVLSFLFPIVGWILWGVYNGSSPIKAKSCATWAWSGFALTIVFYIIVGVIEELC